MKVIPRYFVKGYSFPEMDGVMRLEDYKASRKSVTIYIFDPGGEYVLFLLGFQKFNNCYKKFLQEVLKGKESTRVGYVQAICRFANLIHEDMDAFKGEGL